MRDSGATFESVFNFRDLGGLPTADGRTVRPGRLFRSATLACLAEPEWPRLLECGIRTVIDLRRPDEVLEQGRVPFFAGYTYRHVELGQEPWPPAEFTSTAQRVGYLAERYLELAEEAADGIAESIRIIADPDAAAVVVHCLAGRDRTGAVIAIVLALLGVPAEVIGADYALSDAAEDRMDAYYLQLYPDEVLPPWPAEVAVAPPAAVLTLLQRLEGRYGSIEAYAAGIGVGPAELARLRAHLLG